MEIIIAVEISLCMCYIAYYKQQLEVFHKQDYWKPYSIP